MMISSNQHCQPPSKVWENMLMRFVGLFESRLWKWEQQEEWGIKKKNITKVEIKEMRGKRVDDGGKENRLQREKK